MELLNFLLFITTVALCYFVPGSQAATNGTDHLALLSFKDLITDDPSGSVTANGMASHVVLGGSGVVVLQH
nr:unnamed protein product [Digitaria exilis]